MKSETQNKTVLIIGGGPAGMSAAISAKKHHPEYRVIILESSGKIGQRIKISGNGRCNFSNISNDPNNYNHPDKAKLVLKTYAEYEISFLDELGFKYYSDEEGRMYPLSNSSETVLNSFIRLLNKYQIEVRLNQNAKSIQYLNNQFKVLTDDQLHLCDYLIIAIGGVSYNYDIHQHIALFRSLDIALSELRPSLCPIKCHGTFKGLEGTRVKCDVSLYEDNRCLAEEYGEVLFKKDGLSGIVIFNLSRFIVQGEYKIFLKLLSDSLLEDFKKEIQATDSIIDVLSNYFPTPLVNYLLELNTSKTKIIESINKLEFKVEAKYGFKYSQVTQGGVDLSLIDKDFNYKKIPNLYIVGEALDIDAKCGGFNIRFAMASGYISGLLQKK